MKNERLKPIKAEQVIVEKPMHLVDVIDTIGIEKAFDLLTGYSGFNYTLEGGNQTYHILIPESYAKQIFVSQLCFQAQEETFTKYGFKVSYRQSKKCKDIVILTIPKKWKQDRNGLNDSRGRSRAQLIPFSPYISLKKAIVCNVSHFINQGEYRVIIENNYNYGTELYNERVCGASTSFPTGEEFAGKIERIINNRKQIAELRADSLISDARKKALEWFASEYPGVDMKTHWELLPVAVSKRGGLN
jgi:hypothetical protein